MKITRQNTIESIRAELIRRLIQKRISLGLTQSNAAEWAGVSERTLRRLEVGEDCQFSTIIRLLTTYGLTDCLDQLIPEPTVSPIELFRQQQPKTVLRVVTKRKDKDQTWKWGDEQ